MSYTTYTTPALVCGTYRRNTADGSYQLFTESAGMVHAVARSVREEKSKQRYALQDFSLVRVSLVKGKSGWRIGSVEASENFYHNATSKEARGSVVRMVRLLRRFCGGENPQPELFAYFIDVLTQLSKEQDHRQDIEAIVELRLLLLLGYVDAKKVPPHINTSVEEITKAPLSVNDLTTIERLTKQAVTTSHL